jgi:hypothetical protein
MLYAYGYYVRASDLSINANFKAGSSINVLNNPYHNYKDKQIEAATPSASELPCVLDSALSTSLHSSLRFALCSQPSSNA